MIIMEIIALTLSSIAVLIGGSHACKVMDHNRRIVRAGGKYGNLRLTFGAWEIAAAWGAGNIILYFILKAVTS